MGCGTSVATPTADPKKKRNSVAPSVLDPKKKKSGFARMISVGSGGPKFVVKNGVPGQDAAALSMFTALHLDTLAVNDFFKKFKEIDLEYVLRGIAISSVPQTRAAYFVTCVLHAYRCPSHGVPTQQWP